MINLYYSESYWGHTQTMNGPHKVVKNLLMSLDQGEAYRVPATSIPYWDERCGEVFFNIDELDMTFSKFYAKLDEYDPKAFIKDNLSFECSIKTLLDILR